MIGNRTNRKKLNNKGMSLVEIIVAMAILSAVSVVVLRSMTTSMKYNNEARLKQGATTVGECVMENFKAYDMESLAHQFGNSTLPANLRFMGGNGNTAVMAKQGTSSFTDAIVTNALGEKEFVRSPLESYIFTVGEFVQDGRKYDARVTVEQKEAATVADCAQINEYTDGVIASHENYFPIAYNAILGEVANQITLLDETDDPVELIYTASDMQTDKIKITDVKHLINIYAEGGATKVDYSITYAYEVTGHPYFEEDGTEAYASYTATYDYIFSSGTTTREIYNNTNTVMGGAKLEAIYLYYYPQYKSVEYASADAGDEIVIQSSVGSAIDVFLMKQKNPGYTDAVIQSKETGYRVRVSGSGTGAVNLYHNYNRIIGGTGGVPAAPSIATGDFASVQDYQAKTKEVPLLYSLKVEVFERRDGGALCAGERFVVLEGTMNE